MTYMLSGVVAGRVKHEADAIQTVHVGDLVRIGDDGGGPVRQRRAAELGAVHRLLSMWTCASIRPGPPKRPPRSIVRAAR